MNWSQWIASLWPGFTRAWVLGKWEGVLLATLFAAALNTALLTTFGFRDELQSGAGAGLAWVLVLGFWSVGLWWRAYDLPRLKVPDRDNANRHDELLAKAQQHYLKGHWIEAEAIVVQMLARHSADIEAQLLLASVQRRTRRIAEANRTLTDLLSHPAAAKWQLEIECELQQLNEATEIAKAA